MSGMEPFLLAGAAASTAAGGMMQYEGGQIAARGQRMAAAEQATAADFEANQLKIQSQVAKTNADQAETRRRDELTSNLETIAAIRAGRGVGSASPTGDAIYGSTIEDQERDIAIERNNFLQKADLSRRASEMSTRKGRMSLIAGEYGAAASELAGTAALTSSLGRASSMYAFPSTRRA